VKIRKLNQWYAVAHCTGTVLKALTAVKMEVSKAINGVGEHVVTRIKIWTF